MPMQLLVLKCSEKLCSCIRRLNCVLASPGVAGLKATGTKVEAKTRVERHFRAVVAGAIFLPEPLGEVL